MTDDDLTTHGEWIARGKRIFESGKYARAAADGQPGAEIPGEPRQPADDETAPPPFAFTDGATFILDIPEKIPALWGAGDEVIWAQGESLMIVGPMGLGKTTIGLHLLRARLGLGDAELLGYPIAPSHATILYLAMDRPAQIARAAHRIFTEAERQTLAARLKIWKGPPPADVARNPHILAKLADAADAETLFVDSVKDAALGLSDDEVGAGYNRARQHLLREGHQLAELHHTTKRGAGGGPPTAVADIYGSAWIANGTGSIILLTGEPGDPIVGLRHVRAPADEIGPLRMLHDHGSGAVTVYHIVDLVALAAAGGANGVTAKGAAMAICDTDKPTRNQVEKARRALNKLVAVGLLVRMEGGRGGRAGEGESVWFPAA